MLTSVAPNLKAIIGNILQGHEDTAGVRNPWDSQGNGSFSFCLATNLNMGIPGPANGFSAKAAPIFKSFSFVTK